MRPAKILVALSLLLVTASTQAQTKPQNEKSRIRQGVKSGELTRNETHTLVKEQKDIKEDRVEAKADGIVTPVEKKEIRQDKRQANRSIYRKKHNGRDRD